MAESCSSLDAFELVAPLLLSDDHRSIDFGDKYDLLLPLGMFGPSAELASPAAGGSRLRRESSNEDRELYADFFLDNTLALAVGLRNPQPGHYQDDRTILRRGTVLAKDIPRVDLTSDNEDNDVLLIEGFQFLEVSADRFSQRFQKQLDALSFQVRPNDHEWKGMIESALSSLLSEINPVREIYSNLQSELFKMWLPMNDEAVKKAYRLQV
ncbi:MAG: hypothetical protein Q9217_001087 [Psora testacea]